MHDKNLHIIQNRNREFPKPEIQEDEAWSQMKSLLDAQMPSPPSSSSGGGFKGGGSSFWNTVFVVVGVAAITTWAILHFVNKKSEIVEIPVVNEEKTIAVTDSISIIPLIIDSVIELKNSSLQPNISNSENRPNAVYSESKKAIPAQNALIITETDDKTEEIENKFKADSGINKVIQDSVSNSIAFIDNAENQSKLQDTVSAIPNNYNDSISGKSSLAKPESLKKTNRGKNSRNRTIFQSSPSQNSIQVNRSGTKVKRNTQNYDFWENTHFGLQLNVPLPLQGTNNYFKGFEGENQPYLYLIPDFWISHKFRKHEVGLHFNPFNQTFTNEKLLSSTEITAPDDSTGNTNLNSTFLHKTFGMSGGIFYRFEIFPAFVAGFGIDYNSQSKSLLSDKISSDLTGDVISETFYGITKSDTQWDLSSGFFTGNLEMAWRRKRFDFGTNLKIPLSNLTSTPGSVLKPINGELFLRWKIR